MNSRQLKHSSVAITHQVVQVKPMRRAETSPVLTTSQVSALPTAVRREHPDRQTTGRELHEDLTLVRSSPTNNVKNVKNIGTNKTTRPPDFSTGATGHIYGEMIESKYVEDLCARLRMSKRDVWKMRRQFNEIDVDNTGTITVSEFFFMIKIERCGLSNTILRLADIAAVKARLTFDEYVCCVCQFAAFSEPELLQFVFSLYMTDRKRGFMVEEDVMALAEVLMTAHTAYKGNIRQASQRFNLSKNPHKSSQFEVEGGFTLDDMQQLARQHRVAFYPLLSMQRSTRQATLGERYWAVKAEENHQIDVFVHYIERHGGVRPPLSWREQVWASMSWPRETKAVRLRRLAEEKYQGRYVRS